MEGAARPEERREDTDGKRYLRSEFEAHYGPQARMRWAAALPPGAEWVFVFHCNGRTERECLDRRLLGGPAQGGNKMTAARSISSGTALLLFNFGDRTVYSSLRAAGAPAKGIVPEAWGGKFPWQVQYTGQPVRRERGAVAPFLAKVKRGGWIGSHELPTEWFQDGAAAVAAATQARTSRQFRLHQVQPALQPEPQPTVDLDGASDVFSDTPSSQSDPDEMPGGAKRRSKEGNGLGQLGAEQRSVVENVAAIAGIDLERALHVCLQADFDANRAVNFAFGGAAEPAVEPTVHDTTHEWRQTGPDPGSAATVDTAATGAPAADSAQTWQQQLLEAGGHGDEYAGDDAYGQDEFVDDAGAAGGHTWQQQALMADTTAEGQTGDVDQCQQCGAYAAGGADAQGDGKFYCNKCWREHDSNPGQGKPSLVYMKLNNLPGTNKAEETLLEVLDLWSVSYRQHVVPAGYDITVEIEAAKAEAAQCACILSARRTAEGKFTMGLIWGRQQKEEVSWEQGVSSICSQLGTKPATANLEDSPAAAKSRDHYVHKVIIEQLKQMILRGPQNQAAAARPSQVAVQSGGAFAALGDGLSESDGELTPSPRPESVPMLKRWPRDKRAIEAKKSAAKLMSSYFFRELAEDTQSQVDRTVVDAEAWHRAGERRDPMIPHNLEAWPNIQVAFGLLLMRWWGVDRQDPVIKQCLDELLKWCREAAKSVEKNANKHAQSLPFDWNDSQSGVVRHSGAAGVCLTHGNVSVRVDKARFDVLNMLFLSHQAAGDQFLTRAYNCVLRYETLAKFDQGTQGSVPERVFQVLRSEFGVHHECFASPLNCTMESFNSVFPDVDRFFGSQGSFFDYWPDTGAFEANPPFDEGSVAQCFHHINAILKRAEDAADGDLPLLFVTVTPFVPEHILTRRFVLNTLKLAPNNHAYTLGFNHRKSHEGEWCPNAETCVCFVGNSAAAAQWPVTKEKLALLQRKWEPLKRPARR